MASYLLMSVQMPLALKIQTLLPNYINAEWFYWYGFYSCKSSKLGLEILQ